ncbi:MAG TPA: endonuclease domain-containing protein [Polyangiaceae bacterium]|nr:endonuclease domain-containing protein [Polyangiaceae bacterium]
MVRNSNRSQVSPLNVARAHGMRECPTRSEEALWRALSGSQLGVAFRRQVPFGPFILDFMAPSARLVIEVDGGIHVRRKAADARKERALRRAGYRLIRVDAEAVLRDLPAVLALISAARGR